MPDLPITEGVPYSAFLANILFPQGGASLVAGHCFFHLDMQGDGNLVTYAGPGRRSAWWATGTDRTWQACGNNPCFYAAMQGDGNFVIYDATNSEPWWATGTNGNPNDRLVQQDDGNLVIYGSNDAVLWASNRYESTQSSSTCQRLNIWTELFNFGNTGPQFETFTPPLNSVGQGAESCGIICNLTASCIAYNFNPATGHCGLIATNGNQVPKSGGFVTGFRR
jgi:hypothetical protein